MKVDSPATINYALPDSQFHSALQPLIPKFVYLEPFIMEFVIVQTYLLNDFVTLAQPVPTQLTVEPQLPQIVPVEVMDTSLALINILLVIVPHFLGLKTK